MTRRNYMQLTQSAGKRVERAMFLFLIGQTNGGSFSSQWYSVADVIPVTCGH